MRYIISFLCATLASSAMADVPRVVTDLPPVHSLVAQVMGDLGQPQLLLEAGADAHDFQLRPSQAAALQDAGLIVWVGPEMTPWLDRALEGLAPEKARLGLLAVEGTHRQAFDSTDAHDHGHEAEAGHEGHAHDGVDPHAWLDPENARHWLGLIAGELARLDPDNAATYAANADAARAGIDQLEASIAARLAPAQGKPIFVFHNAYGYFAAHFGLTVAGTLADGDAADPGAAHLAELREAVARNGAACVFPEAGHDAAPVEAILEGTGARSGAPLDPEGTLVPPGPAAYATILTSLADAIADCAGQ